MDRDAPLLEGLAQGVEDRGRELGRLVEEEDAPVGERDGAGRRDPASPADERRGRRAVVGRLEGRGAQERAPLGQDPGERMERRRLEGDAIVEIGEDPGQARGEHRLAGSGLALEEEVVSSGGRDEKRVDRSVLATHVREVAFVRRRGGRRWSRRALEEARPRRAAARPYDDVGEVGEAENLDPWDEAGLVDALDGHDDPADAEALGGGDGGEDPAHGPQSPVESEFGEERRALEGGSVDGPGGDEDRHRDREVEARPRLREPRGREIDGDPRVHHLEVAALERRADAILRLAQRGVGQADEREGDESAPDVRLDVDEAPLESEEGDRADGGDAGAHAMPRTHVALAPRVRRSFTGRAARISSRRDGSRARAIASTLSRRRHPRSAAQWPASSRSFATLRASIDSTALPRRSPIRVLTSTTTMPGGPSAMRSSSPSLPPRQFLSRTTSPASSSRSAAVSSPERPSARL